MPNKIIYLHGFNSSPQSYKAQHLLAYVTRLGKQERLIIPTLSPYPGEAIEQIESIARSVLDGADDSGLCFVGSSLGGYYSTWFAERYDTPAVLINPSVRPYETLAEYIGENENYYTAERWLFDRSHIQQLLDIDVKTITRPERYLVLLQTGDEVLDYRQAEEKYAGSQLMIEQGGDHSFTNFDNYLDRLIDFAGL